jgi:cobaltochelatase CobS
MSSSDQLADTEVLVWSKRKGEQTVPVAELIGPHPKVAGRYVYALDKAKGAKAPNAASSAPSATVEPTATPAAPAPVTGADGDAERLGSVLADILSKPQIDGAMVESIARAAVEQALIDYSPEAPRVQIDIRDAVEVKALEGTHHMVLPDVLESLAVGNHVYLVGPAGSGKTTLAEGAAEALGRTLYITGAMLTKHEVLGYQTATGGYVSTAARDAFEHGGILLWDEVDSSSPAALVAVNAMLSNSQYTFPDKTVKRHEDFVVIAAGNTYGRGADREYVGRMQLDAATLDRFDVLEVDYDNQLELAIAEAQYTAFGGTDRNALNQYVRQVQQYRERGFDLKVKHVISPRASINGAKLLARGATVAKIAERCVWKGIPADTRKQLES